MESIKETPQARYDKRMTKIITMKLNRGTDAEILAKLKSVENIQGYIKELIRKDIMEEKSMEAKYWIDTKANGGFVLYKKTENDEAAVLSFTFEDVPGSKELEEAEKIGEAWELIDKYIESKLGFLPDYEVN